MNYTDKIFVAGGTGMVGSAIIRRLLSSGYENIVSNYNRKKPIADYESRVGFVPIDLTRQSVVEAFFEKERPDYVFLAAAKVGGILANSTYKAEFIYDNIVIAANVIHAAYKSKVRKLLNLGSSCIYPKYAPQPMKEEYLLTGPLEPTNEPYAIAKISAIKLCRYYNEQYHTNFMSVMPTNLYGTGDSFGLKTSHVLPALIRKMHLGKCLQEGDLEAVRKDLRRYPLNGCDVSLITNADMLKELSGYGIKVVSSADQSSSATSSSGVTAVELWGSGEPYREFLYVDELADACVFLMETCDAGQGSSDINSGNVIGEFINIGSGEDLKIKELASLVREVVGFGGEIIWDASKPDGTPRKLLDVSRIRSLGWQPKIGLREGIKRTYEWYRSQQLYA